MITQCFLQKADLLACTTRAFFGINLGLGFSLKVVVRIMEGMNNA